jgi:hypothetical protein
MLGKEHSFTLTSIANLASIYTKQEQWKKAEELFIQTTEIMKKLQGKKHPNTLINIANLVWTYRNQGQ